MYSGDQRGEGNGHNKLTAAQVLEIRARYAKGTETFQALADEYGVVNSTISKIVHGQRWAHLQAPEEDEDE
jgi:hypothetical protein